MSKSIRVTDDLYQLAEQEAEVMQRSLNQQVEHWVKLGIAMEQAGASLGDIRAASMQYRQYRDEMRIRAGRMPASSLHVVPAALDRRIKAEFPANAFRSVRRSW